MEKKKPIKDPVKKKKKPIKEPVKNKKKEPVKKTKKNNGFIIEKDNESMESGKYSEKLNSLINKIKNQNDPKSDVRIRFGWK